MRYLSLLSVLVLTLPAVACHNGPPMHTDFNPTVDFTRFSSFEFEEDDGATPVAPAIVEVIRHAIRDDLATKSLTEKPGAADLSIALVIVLDQETGGGTGAYYWDERGGTEPSNEYVVDQGTLMIDFYDNSNSQRVWRSVTSGAVSRTGDHDPEALDAVVKAMLENYPPVHEEH